MMTPRRFSPIDSLLRSLPGDWQDIHHLSSLMRSPHDRAYANCLGLADLSCLPRFGVKGPNAAEWLAQQGLPIPDRPNTWCALSAGGIIARLGMTEFLVEDSLHSSLTEPLAIACQSPPPRVYPVLRQDLALGLRGDRLPDLLRQTCSVNFQALSLADRPVILTSMIGVAVVVIPGNPYRLWCDGTFGPYVWTTLVDMATELGGGAIGVEMFFNKNAEGQADV